MRTAQVTYSNRVRLKKASTKSKAQIPLSIFISGVWITPPHFFLLITLHAYCTGHRLLIGTKKQALSKREGWYPDSQGNDISEAVSHAELMPNAPFFSKKNRSV